nr:immunoglobulin heavy chain junction region [Mus musculus]
CARGGQGAWFAYW